MAEDQLIAYWDVRLRELTEQIVRETAQQFAASRKETAEEFAKLRKETTEAMAKLREETSHTRVLVEDLSSKIQLVAEQGVGLAETLERYRREAGISFDQVKGWIEPYFRDVHTRLLILEKRAERQDKDSSGVAL